MEDWGHLKIKLEIDWMVWLWEISDLRHLNAMSCVLYIYEVTFTVKKTGVCWSLWASVLSVMKMNAFGYWIQIMINHANDKYCISFLLESLMKPKLYHLAGPTSFIQKSSWKKHVKLPIFMNPLVLIPPAVPLSRLACINCKEIPHKHVETSA